MPTNVKLQGLSSQTFICDDQQKNSSLTRVLFKSGNGYWHGTQVNFDGSGSYSGSNASMAGATSNATSQATSVVCGASDILGAAANYTTLMYEAKAFFDSSNNNLANAQSYFGREIARSLGGTISTYSNSTPSLNSLIQDMFEIYDNGGWVTGPSGVPFNGCFSNPTGNGVPNIEAYWNFSDGTSFRTTDASGGTVGFTIFDKAGNATSHNLTMAGSAPGQENIYNEGPTTTTGGMMGLDWGQNTGQGATYARNGSTNIPITSSGDVCVIFYLGKRTANTSSTAARYIWDCRQGGGKYMLSNSSGEAFDWNGNITGGTPSGLTNVNHFITAIANPTGNGNGEEIRASYDVEGGSNGVQYQQIAVNSGTMNSGMNIVGSDFVVATNSNNLGASKYPGPFSILGMMKVPGECWSNDISADNREKLIKMLHMHHYYMLTTNSPA